MAVIMTMAIFISGSFTSCKPSDPVDSLPDEKVVKRYIWYELSEEEKAKDQYFEETTGLKVKKIMVPWENYDSKIMIDIAANNAPDVVYINDEKWPVYAIKNIVQDIDTLLPADSELWKNTNAMNVYMWGGKHYGIAKGIAPILLWYNKTMFEDNDMKTPRQMYEENNWNWETFREAAMALTKDLDGDGETDQWGFGTWRYDAMLMSNGGHFFKYTIDRKIELMLDSVPTLNALQFIQDAACKDKWLKPDGMFSYINDFRAGKMAMTAEAAFVAWNGVFTDVPFEKDFAPFPLGPDNKQQIYPGRCDASGVCSKAKNPEGAIKYILAGIEFGEKNSDKSMAKITFSDDQLEFHKEIEKKNLEVELYMGVGNIREKQFDLLNECLYNNTPLATVLAAQKPVWLNQIELCLKDTELPDVKPFSPPGKEDFEDGEWGSFVATNSDGNLMGVSKLEVIDDTAKAIEGKSLLITTDPDQPAGILLRSDPEKIKIPGYHVYRITFDYRFFKDMEEGAFMAVTIRPADDLINGKTFGWSEIKEAKANEVGHLSMDVMLTQEIDNLSLCILGNQTGDVVIDNIDIVEYLE